MGHALFHKLGYLFHSCELVADHRVSEVIFRRIMFPQWNHGRNAKNIHADGEQLMDWPGGFVLCNRHFPVDNMNRISWNCEVWVPIFITFQGYNLSHPTFHKYQLTVLTVQASCNVYSIVGQCKPHLYSVRKWCIL